MIREFQRDDINKVADIWLDTNIKGNKFRRNRNEKCKLERIIHRYYH